MKMKIEIELTSAARAFRDVSLVAVTAVIVIGPFIYSFTRETPYLFFGLCLFYLCIFAGYHRYRHYEILAGRMRRKLNRFDDDY